jgi:prepilin-type processing-associated H-X9-DG protein
VGSFHVYASANALLLPYFEQTALLDLYDMNRRWENQSARVAATVIPHFVCPSTAQKNPITDLRLIGIVDNLTYGRTDYIYCKGVTDAWCFRTVGQDRVAGDVLTSERGMFDLNLKIAAHHIRDGTSQTFAMGEGTSGAEWAVCRGTGCLQPHIGPDGRQAEAHLGWIIGEPSSTVYFSRGLVAASLFGCTMEPLNKRPVTDTFIHIAGLFSDCRSSARGGQHSTSNFRSDHAGGGNFLMADGSVRFVAEAIDMDSYRGLSTIDGGEVIRSN